MTYLDYLNDFHRWLESGTLPGSSQLMYFKLLNVFNRAGWPEYVRVDNLRMMVMIGAESKQAVIRARDKLVESGFVEFQKGKKGSPSRYYLGKGSHNVTENATESVTVSDTESVTENVTHNKTEKKIKNPPQVETGFGDDLQSAFEAWLAYKAEKRQGYQATGLQCLVTEIRNNAKRYGEVAVAKLIRECMASNWRGIIFDRLKQGGGQAPLEQPVPKFDPETGTWR